MLASGSDYNKGLGSRHRAVASITKHTQAIAVVVTESSIVRIFDNGEIISEIIPALWLFRRHGLHLTAPYSTRHVEEVTVASKKQ